MRSRYKIYENDDTHFLTATIKDWIPVFTHPEACQIIIDSLAFCREHNGLQLYAYVIMDNHIHLIARAPGLNNTIQSFKRHTAKQILTMAKKTGREWLINHFAFHTKTHKTESEHQVWQEGAHPQLIQGDKMLNQKIDYIHNNPVERGWVDTPEHWRYSSARNYFLEDHSLIEIDSIHDGPKPLD